MTDPIVLPAPPVPETTEGNPAWLNALPMLGSVGSIAVVAGASGGGARTWLAGGSFLAATLLFVAVQLDRQRTARRRRIDALRRGHLRALAAVRRELRAAAAAPATGVVWGHGPGPLPVEMVLPEADPAADPWCVAAGERLVAAHRIVDRPLSLDLATTPLLVAPTRANARALLRAAALAHSPTELAVAVVTGDRPAWEWLAWLPHARSRVAADDLGARRLVAASYEELGELLDGRRLLLIDELAGGAPPTPAAGAPVTVVTVGSSRGGVVLAAERAHSLSEPEARAWARGLGASGHTPDRAGGLADLLGIDPTAWRGWTIRSPGDHLRVPLGIDDAGAPVILDLKEAARGGIGPHGLLVGATGSGKSELLRTLVTGLALTHAPDSLNLVLVDFKGGATFAGLGALPHTSAVITNLADDLALVDRMHDALTGELERRQRLLQEAGVSTADEHPALPHLLVIVDEFSELLAARPEFTDLFVQIGRLGRSLGLHLLLATQRLEEGRLRGLESHLSYRLGLRTFSAAESRTVLGVPDAHHLPASPGVGYLRAGPDTLIRFRAAHAGAPVRREAAARVRPLTTAHLPGDGRTGESLLDAMLRLLADQPGAAHEIWLPPLAEPPRQAALPVGAVGIVDLPRAQRHEPLLVDRTGGHVAIVGGPRSGRSTLAATVVCALAATSPPSDLPVHVVDLGGALGGLETLPHLSSRPTRDQPDLVRRVIGEAATAPCLLVIDGWATFRGDYPDLEPAVLDLATTGLARGVRLVVTSPRWVELRSGLRDQFETRLELRLGDPLDSEVDRRTAASVPRVPGRGLTPDGHHFLAALPDPAVVAARWPGSRARRVRSLPESVDLAEGFALTEDGPVAVPDLLLVAGDPGSGRSTALLAAGRAVTGRLLVVDPRRTLTGLPADRMLDQLTMPTAIREGVAGLATYLTGRLPTTGPPRDRPWTGEEVTLLVDDHDLVALGDDPLRALLPLLPHARDLGLRVLIARRAAGLARTLHDPVLGLLRDLGAPALVLSCATAEMPVYGVRPTAAPPGRGRLVTGSTRALVQVSRAQPPSP